MKVVLNSKAVQRLQKGHPWVFKSDIQGQRPELAGVTSLFDRKEKFLGKALYSPSSEISIRFLSPQDISIDQNFWKERLQKAFELRQSLCIHSNAYRMVFGESDGIPSFILDRYGEAYALQILSAGLESVREDLLSSVREVFFPSLLVERNDVSVRKLEKLPMNAQVLGENALEPIEIREGELTFKVNLLEGQKTGAFLDQRDNRLKAINYAQGKKRILDVFSYQGGFACQMASKAHFIKAIDQSAEACNSLRQNAILNKLSNIEAIEANAFDYLKEADQKKEKFDLINLDPPAFVKSKKQLQDALRGYKEINLRAMKMLESGGILISSSCSHHLSEQTFLEVIEKAALDAKKRVQILERGTQGPDHPVLLGFPESSYLKCFFMRIL